MRLQHVNLVGVLILAGFCIVQWRVNRNLNLEINHRERLRLEQQTQLRDRDRAILGHLADLDHFREQLNQASARLKQSEHALATMRHDLHRLTLERDKLRISVTNWVEAVATRDQQLEAAADQLTQLREDRNKVVNQFNDLAEKQNAIVRELYDRSRKLNELAERYQKLAKP